MKVLFVCERSGGHTFPAQAIAEKMREKYPGIDIYFFASASFLQDYLRHEGFVVLGRVFKSRFLLAEAAWRLVESIYILTTLNPDKVYGFGGRDSFFLLLFAAFIGKDTAVYEPNVGFGRANKVLSFFVRRVLRGFESAAGAKEISIGIPLRRNLQIMPRPRALEVFGFDDKPVILCLGGSQGSNFLNRVMLEFVCASDKDFQLIHLTGKRDYLEIKGLYNKITKKAFLKDFYPGMAAAYSAADIVISRAGAVTLGEIAYFAIPAVLIPHPCAGGHQCQNAYYFKRRRAAYLLEQDKFEFSRFKAVLDGLLSNPGLREELRGRLKTIRLGVNFDKFYQDIIL